ncbi:MAG TPA: phosphate/phosphite/phosphonate ABC transporter substrate-binding protein [Candidatus Krumholzibacteria bacterium]|nr:phosphate/phosphite/phosphonate ABC transporter substrate-binding protein [Candidatus Krumholzibacteria bacterium]
MRKFVLLTALVLTVAVFCAPTDARADVKIGVLAKRGAPKCMQQWGATGEYLSGKLGQPVQIIPLKFEAIEPAVAAGQVDFVLANSAFYIGLQQQHGVQAVATLINANNGHAVSEFGGVIVVKADSPIRTIEDLKGKRFMAVQKTSFGGAQMAWREMVEHGVDPEKDCAEFTFGNKHDNVVLAVLNGAADAGTVRSDTIERMAAEGAINLADLRVINRIDDDFPFAHSTRLYPEWPLAACKGTDPGLARQVSDALQALQPGDTAAVSAKIMGWKAPADYTPVEDCLKAIGFTDFAAIQ